MAKQKQTQMIEENSAQEVNMPISKRVQNTFFNIKEIHLERIKRLFELGNDKVIIHGDGCLFASKLGQKFGESGETIEQGSDYHKEFNSGAPTVNKNELVARAGYRAIYERGKAPKSVDEIIDDFYANEAKEMQAMTKPENKNHLSNTVLL